MENEQERLNRRQHLRFGLHIPLFGELSLSRVGGTETQSKVQRVLFDNISFGGCLFRTHLRIPLRDDVVWSFKLHMGIHIVHTKGIVLRAMEEEGYYLYGAAWKQSAYERQLFRYRLNEYLLSTYSLGPHIESFYRQLTERDMDESFKRWDVST